MSNMSYCRFQNTRADLRDCVEYLRENSFDKEQIKDDLSEEEFIALLSMVEMAKAIANSSLGDDE